MLLIEPLRLPMHNLDGKKHSATKGIVKIANGGFFLIAVF